MIRNRWMVRAAVLALVAIVAPATAYAASPSQLETVSVKVSYSDLNIHSAAGAQVLYGRLKRASKQACNLDPASTAGLSERSRAKACYRDTLDKAVAGIDSHYSHMGRPHTTIGAERFHFRVRNGIGWFPLAIAARQTGWEIRDSYRRIPVRERWKSVTSPFPE